MIPIKKYLKNEIRVCITNKKLPLNKSIKCTGCS